VIVIGPNERENPLSCFDIYTASTWVIPVLLAVTLHEAAHGYVAHLFGDDTALRQGRVSFNPLKHVDPFGTILLPALLLLSRAPFLFGYAKPVPVSFQNLRHPRRDMIWVAAAGPAMNLLLALTAALLFHVVGYFPKRAAPWLVGNLTNAISINVFLAVFNMLPLLPLDGGRVLLGLLPKPLARPFARTERYGMLILLALLFLLPVIEGDLGFHTDLFSQVVTKPSEAIIHLMTRLAGNR
jgi:Zn-dependent protease